MCAAQARSKRNPDNRLPAVSRGGPFSADPEHEALRLPLTTRADPASLRIRGRNGASLNAWIKAGTRGQKKCRKSLKWNYCRRCDFTAGYQINPSIFFDELCEYSSFFLEWLFLMTISDEFYY
jgi:hypothetical protein